MSSSGNFPLTFKLQVQGDAEVVNKFKQIATAMNQVAPAATKTSQSAKQAETSLKSVGTSAGSASTALTGLSAKAREIGSSMSTTSSSTNTASTSFTGLSTSASAAAQGVDATKTSVAATTPQMASMGNEGVKTKGKLQQLTDVFQGNKGLIFSTTMLSSGIVEAIGMSQGWQDASEKLTQAKEKEADLLARGMEGTKEYGEAVKDVADAQRGYNFITRFTIQSFGDLVPMTLMLSSSLLGLVSDVGGLTAAKTKLAAAGTKLVGVIKAVGAAMLAVVSSNKLLTMLALISTAVIALIKNWGGFRDAVNQLGEAMGNALPFLKEALSWLGLQGNAALDTADSFLTYGGTAVAQTNDVEKAVLKTGDATVLSYQEQIELMAKMGDESGNLAVSLGAHLKQQEQAEESHNQKYKQFAEAMQTGNEDIMKSLGLTADEFKDFSQQFQDEVEAFDETWATAVEHIKENWASVTEGFSDSTDSTVGEIIKLEDKITELTAQQWELDDKKALKKNRDEIAQNQAKIDELRGTTSGALGDMSAMYDIFGSDVQTAMNSKITPSMEQAGRDFIALGDAAKQGIDSIRLGILSQDFDSAVKTLQNALDGVPAKYQGNFSEINAILSNSALTQREKISEIVDTYGSLEAASKPLIVGAYELSRSQAEVAASLDEVAVAARNNMTDVSQSGTAWEKFVSNLKPAQKDLPIIQDLIDKVSKGVITQEEALKRAEAAGQAWSEVMGKDVATSVKTLQKSFIDMGDGTSQMVGQINGQMVNLGRVSNTELGNLTDDTELVNSAMSKTGQTAAQSIGNEATTAVGVFGKDGKFHFGTVVDGANNIIAVFKAVDTYAGTYVEKGAGGKIAGLGTTMADTGKDVKTETDSWSTNFTGFKDAVVSSWNAITEALNTKLDLGAAANTLVTSLNEAITKEFPKLVQQGGELVTQIGNGIMNFAKTIEPSVEAIINHFITGTQKKYQEILTVGGAIVEQVTKGVTQFAKTIGPTAEMVVNNFVTGIQKVASQVLEAGKGLVTQIGAGIESLFPQLKTKGNATTTAFRDAVVSSMKLLLDVGKGMISNIVSGINSVASNINKAGSNIGTWLDKGVKSFNLALLGRQIIDLIAGGIGTVAKKIQEAITKPFTDAKTAVENLFKGWDPLKLMGDAGKAILDALNNAGKTIGGIIPQSGQNPQGQITQVADTTGQQSKKQAGAFDAMITQLFLLDKAIKQVQTSFSAFSTSMATYAKSMTANMGAFFTKIATAIPLLDSQVKTHQATWSGFSTSLLAYSTSMTANIGKFFTTISQALIPLDAAVKAHQTTWSSFSTSLLAYSTSMTANLGTFFTTTVAALIQLDAAVKAHQATWSGFSTSILAYATSMTTNLGTFFKTIVAALTQLDTAVKAHQKTWSTFSTSVATYAKSMTTNVSNFVNTTRTGLTNVASQITKTQGVASKFSTSWASYMKSMTANVKSFASATVKAMNDVTSAANKATSALNKMAAAAKKAAAARASVGGMEHGGSFVTHAQKGFSGIVNRPTTYKGVRMGEGFKEEMITVTPLTRGTGNHMGPTVSSDKGSGGGGRSNTPINFVIPVVINNREFGRAVKQTTLEDMGLQV